MGAIDYSKWTPNIEVSVWGKGKATANKRDCPIPIGTIPPNAKYHGDCQDCDHFMGAKFEKTPMWGDWVKACCWAKIEQPAPTPPAKASKPVPLTHEQLVGLYCEMYGSDPEPIDEFADVCRRVEAAHGIGASNAD